MWCPLCVQNLRVTTEIDDKFKLKMASKYEGCCTWKNQRTTEIDDKFKLQMDGKYEGCCT